MEKDARIYIAGHSGLVGSAFVRAFNKQGYNNIIYKSHSELDLIRQREVENFFACENIDVVINAAALVGGIKANNDRPAEFFYNNMQIEQNLLNASLKHNVKKFLFLGSTCMYPTDCVQPMYEECILTGLPEPTNEGYALAKICGMRLCSYINRQYGLDYISAIPANTYGPGDTFDLLHSHVIPALILKFYKAKRNNDKEITLWGSGKALREFIYSDDIADAGIFLLNNYSDEKPINIGTGEEISIYDLACLIKKIVGYDGDIITDCTKPDGMKRRICDSSKLHALGWYHKTTLKEGIENVYKIFLATSDIE